MDARPKLKIKSKVNRSNFDQLSGYIQQYILLECLI